MRSFDGKPEPTPYEREALLQTLLAISEAISEAHGPRRPKPKNIDPAWLPPEDWTPEGEEADGDEEPT